MKKVIILLLVTLSLCVMNRIALANDAKLGPGDVLKISVFGFEDMGGEAKVSSDGMIGFSPVGRIKVAGLTPAQAESHIEHLLKAGRFVRDPKVSVYAPQLQSQQISVLGQVNKPGRYPIDGKRSITDLLAMAGGINPEGSELITLVRARGGNSTRETIDLLNMVQSGDMNKNIELSSNDVIYVERAPKFYIYGEVQKPGSYRLERNMTILQALSAGGGLTPRGTERGVRIKRRGLEGNIEVMTVKHDELVQNEDIVYVRESLF